MILCVDHGLYEVSPVFGHNSRRQDHVTDRLTLTHSRATAVPTHTTGHAVALRKGLCMFASPLTRLVTAAALTACGSVVLANPSADQVQTRLDLAGDLNVMVHQTAASVCMINAGVSVDAETQALAAARIGFADTLAALATSPAAEEVERVTAAWMPVDGSISMILAGDTPATYHRQIMDHQPQLEFATLQLLDRMANDYEHAAGVNMSDVLTVDLAERQEVFVQKLKTQGCLMAATDVSTDLIQDLANTAMIFETTLDALTHGVPEIGITKSDSFEVNQVLAIAAYDWQRAKPVLDRIAVNGTATAEDLAALRRVTDVLAERMDLLVQYYLAVPPAVEGEPQVAALTTVTE